MKITLSYHKAYSWYSSNNVHVKGYFFDKNDNFLKGKDLLNFFSGITNESEFKRKLQEGFGMFSVVIATDEKVLAACDSSGMFPLFYKQTDDGFDITDNPENFKFSAKEINKNAVQQFLSAAYTLGSRTLISGIYQIQAGELAVFKKAKLQKRRFFSYAAKPNEYIPKHKDTLAENALKAYKKSFFRTFDSMEGRMAVIPLSGGYDSRLIAALLKQYGYKNVLCFTYGRAGNFELENSRKTAEKLGFPWVFVEYTHARIKNYIQSDTFKDYVRYAGKLVSMPYLQDYFALQYLSERKIIDDDAVFLPGFPGDFLAGSQYGKAFTKQLKTENLPDVILYEKFNLLPLSKKKKRNIRNEIKQQLQALHAKDSDYSSYSRFEDWDVPARRAKYIFNSCEQIHYLGYEIRLPFWDKYIIDFSKSLSYELKENKNLYKYMLKEKVFGDMGLNFEQELQHGKFTIKLQKIKNKIKPYFPYFILNRFLYRNDWKFYKEITDEMQIWMKKRNIPYQRKVKLYSAIIVQWYIAFIKDYYKSE
jgi:asparagine synthase (glutamine-hydrolysing)